MQQLCLNGSFFHVSDPILVSSNRGFRYGDGLFETMRMNKGTIPLASLHFERLFHGLNLLEIDAADLSAKILLQLITQLVGHNGNLESARVRLAVFRNEQNKAEFLIEAFALETPQVIEHGLSLTTYNGVRKQCDAFSNLKSANYLPYVMAERFAWHKKVDEAIILNMHGNICDGSKTNLFLIRDHKIYTPGLDQGCVAGVMRRHALDVLQQQGITVIESSITENDLLEADEIFLTNAIRGIQWVKQLDDKTLSNTRTKEIYRTVIPTIFH